MKDKTLDCLKYAAMPVDVKRNEFYTAITAKYSERAVERKLEELKRRGQVCFGPDGLTLTDGGRDFLESFLSKRQDAVDFVNYMTSTPSAL